MIGAIKITERGPVPRKLRQAHNAAAKAAWHEVGVVWVRDVRPKHFTEAGAREYRYGRRSKAYTERKRRETGRARPLVYTGRSERQTRQARISTTSRGGRISMRAPALNFKHPKSRIRPREELTRISRRDAELLARVFDRHYERGVRAIHDTTTRRVA